jgi:hypothetical protein
MWMGWGQVDGWMDVNVHKLSKNVHDKDANETSQFLCFST